MVGKKLGVNVLSLAPCIVGNVVKESKALLVGKVKGMMVVVVVCLGLQVVGLEAWNARQKCQVDDPSRIAVANGNERSQCTEKQHHYHWSSACVPSHGAVSYSNIGRHG